MQALRDIVWHSRAFNYTAVFTRSFSAEAVPAFSAINSLTDMRFPSAWYPLARSLNRRIIAHLGPTNSGKTHRALTALSEANSGVYCGPLRLLAWEIAHRLNSMSILCNLVTGQEVREIPGARHVASTVEMAGTSQRCDVAVIDELQLLSDSNRGWAFTRAFLGIPADEVHVCGDPAMLPLLERLCLETREPLTVNFYERLVPLKTAPRALKSLEEVTQGDCVVAFSRREVHSVRNKIERAGNHRCAVVYGALPPESRSQQAQLFNTPGNGVGVLSASDAVGMGLNLAIRRIVFSTLSKYDGVQDRNLTATEIKQIAGRAGRFASGFPEGLVTAMSESDMPLLREALASPVEPIAAAAVFPRYEQIESFATALENGQLLVAENFHQLAASGVASPHHSNEEIEIAQPQQLYPQRFNDLADILDAFAANATLNGDSYFYAEFEEVKANAVMLRHLNLTLREAYVFSISPCDPADTFVAEALVNFATAFSQGHAVTPDLICHPPLTLANSSEELRRLEATHRAYDLFIWLAYRFEDGFVGREKAEQLRTLCAMYVDESIRVMSTAPLSSKERWAGARKWRSVRKGLKKTIEAASNV